MQGEDGAPGNCWEFLVRPARVRAALLWLKCNNEYYAGVEIAEGQIQEFAGDVYVYGTQVDGAPDSEARREVSAEPAAGAASDEECLELFSPMPASDNSQPLVAMPCAGDGDCFFVSVGTATGHTVAQLRGMVLASASRQRFLHYRGMFETARTALQEASHTFAAAKAAQRPPAPATVQHEAAALEEAACGLIGFVCPAADSGLLPDSGRRPVFRGSEICGLA